MHTLSRRFAAVFSVIVFASLPASLLAQPAGSLFRAYLASTGNDANPCTLPQPCRLLPAALAAIGSGGEVWMLDSANYNLGPVSVTKSATIRAVPGALGSLLAVGGNAVNISGSNSIVVLENLTIRPQLGSESFDGVVVVSGSGGLIVLQSCNVFGFTGGRGVATILSWRVSVFDSTFRENEVGVSISTGGRARIAGSRFFRGGTAIYVTSGIANATSSATLDDVVIADMITGMSVNATAFGAVALGFVKETVIDSVQFTGIYAASSLGTVAEVSVHDSFIAMAGSGMRAFGAGAKVTAGANTVTGSTIGLRQENGAQFNSAGNNVVRNAPGGANTAGIITNVGTM